MPLAKVKITERLSGQEYLLAATKINLKGILVETRRTLPLGTLVNLSIQIEEGRPLDVKGEVHKIAERAGGGTGMIIRFIDPNADALRRIELFARRAERLPEPASPEYTSRERTMMVDMNTLSKLSLGSADEGNGNVASTVDEEAVHAAHPGLGGETRIAEIRQFGGRPSRKKKGFSFYGMLIVAALLFVVSTLILSSGLILRYLDRKFGLKSPTELPPNIEALKTAAPAPPPVQTNIEAPPIVAATSLPIRVAQAPMERSIPRPKVTNAPPEERPTVGKIERVSVEKGETFLKVIIQGSANFSRATASRAMSPRRLMIDLPNVTNFSQLATIPVTENPLLRIRTEKVTRGLRITLDLYPVEFPRYDIKPHADSLDIFLHK